MSEPLDLALTVLDRQLVDCQGHRCGRVDDIELAGEPGTPLTITYLLVGQRAAIQRLPRALRLLMAPFARGSAVPVAWANIDDVSHVVKLSKTDDELGLGRGERRAAHWLARFPGAR